MKIIGKTADEILRSVDLLEASHIGKAARELREEKGLTIEEMAERMSKILREEQYAGGEVTTEMVGKIENGEIETPSDPVLRAMASVLGVSTDRLTQ